MNTFRILNEMGEVVHRGEYWAVFASRGGPTIRLITTRALGELSLTVYDLRELYETDAGIGKDLWLEKPCVDPSAKCVWAAPAKEV